MNRNNFLDKNRHSLNKTENFFSTMIVSFAPSFNCFQWNRKTNNMPILCLKQIITTIRLRKSAKAAQFPRKHKITVRTYHSILVEVSSTPFNHASNSLRLFLSFFCFAFAITSQQRKVLPRLHYLPQRTQPAPFPSTASTVPASLASSDILS